jgi:hypothetical protein
MSSVCPLWNNTFRLGSRARSASASKAADGLHLLRVAQLHFQLAPLRHVLGNARNPDYPARRVAHWKAPVTNPTHDPIGTHDAVL